MMSIRSQVLDDNCSIIPSYIRRMFTCGCVHVVGHHIASQIRGVACPVTTRFGGPAGNKLRIKASTAMKTVSKLRTIVKDHTESIILEIREYAHSQTNVKHIPGNYMKAVSYFSQPTDKTALRHVDITSGSHTVYADRAWPAPGW